MTVCGLWAGAGGTRCRGLHCILFLSRAFPLSACSENKHVGEQWDWFFLFSSTFFNTIKKPIKESVLTKKGSLYVNEENQGSYANMQSERSFAFLMSAHIFAVERLFIKYLVKTGHWRSRTMPVP